MHPDTGQKANAALCRVECFRMRIYTTEKSKAFVRQIREKQLNIGYFLRENPCFIRENYMKIPKIIQGKAKELGYKDCFFLGMTKGAQAFQLSFGFKGEEPPPTGLPVVLLLRGNKVTVVSGLEALELF